MSLPVNAQEAGAAVESPDAALATKFAPARIYGYATAFIDIACCAHSHVESMRNFVLSACLSDMVEAASGQHQPSLRVHS